MQDHRLTATPVRMDEDDQKRLICSSGQAARSDRGQGEADLPGEAGGTHREGILAAQRSRP